MARTTWSAVLLVILTGEAMAQQVQIDPVIVTRNDALKATLKLKSPLRGEGKLSLTWTDSYGRTVAAEDRDVKVDGDTVALTLPLARAVAMLNFLEGKLAIGEQAVAIPKTEFIVTPDAGKWDDYQVIMYYAYGTPRQQEALRDCGITAGQIQSGRTTDPNGARTWWQHDYRFYCDQILHTYLAAYHTPAQEPKDKALREAKAAYKKDRTSKQPFYRHPCFHDLPARQQAMERMRAAARAQMRFKPFFYGTDEVGVANLVEAWDFCFDPRTIRAMQAWLLKEYGSLEAINKQWGTNFARIEDVVPLDTDEMMARKKPDGSDDDNYSPWADHRAFMNLSFAQVLKETSEAVKSADKEAIAGILGGQMPGAFGGYDYWLLSQAMDAIEPYNIGNNREVWRSFAPKKPACTTGFGFGDMEIWRLWYQALHGDLGLIIYDEKNQYLDKDAAPTRIGAGVAPTYTELTGGIVKQLAAMERVNDPIAIHYSQPSMTAHWMLENRPRQKAGRDWVDRGSSTERTQSEFLRLRESWVRLPEDNSLGYYFVSYAQLENGDFDKMGAKVLILPQSVAMSKAECDAVRRFVANGGTAIADCRLALMDEHCRTLEKGQLDDLFGIERSDLKFAPGQPGLQYTGGFVRVGNLAKVPPAEPGIKVARGAWGAYSSPNGTPAVIEKQHGKGKTVYLNAVLTDYHRWRMKPPEGEDLRKLMANLFTDAGVRPQYAIGDAAEGKFANIIAEVHPFQSGELRIVGLHRNYQIRTNELGPPEYQKQEALEQPLKVKIGFGAPVAVYDQRAGKFLGRMAEAAIDLDRIRPTILALLPEPVEKLTVTAPAEVKAGEIIEARLQLVGPKLGDVHAFRVRLLDAQGRELRMLTRNILAPKGQASCKLPVALSDPKGQYTLQVRDVPTGTTAEHKVAVK